MTGRATWLPIVLLAAAMVAAAPAGGRTNDAGALSLQAELRLTGSLGECAAGTPPTIECIDRKGQGRVSGLGAVSESYVYLIDGDTKTTCPAGASYFHVLSYPVQLVVAGKGTLDLLLQGRPECLVDAAPNLQFLEATQPWTVTGGSGRYAGASGSGTVRRTVAQGACFCHSGIERWEGTIAVPGLEFDVTAPVLSGAKNRTVVEPRQGASIRVRFALTARDDRDGAVPVVCTPRSGSSFRVGRTRVGCTASDSSGNMATASFAVVVKRRR